MNCWPRPRFPNLPILPSNGLRTQPHVTHSHPVWMASGTASRSSMSRYETSRKPDNDKPLPRRSPRPGSSPVKNHGTTRQAEEAVGRAAAAFAGWRDTDALKRAGLLIRAAQSMRARRDELAGMIIHEAGKP